MKFECLKERFYEAFSKAEKLAGKGGVNPLLKGVILEGKDSTLTIKSTNLDLGIEVSVPVKLSEPGTVLVSASTLLGFISNLDKEKSIKFQTKEETLVVETEHSSAVLKLNPPDEFPLIPHIMTDKSFSLSSKDLIQGLRSVVYSASLSTIKPELASVYIYQEDGEIVFVATDSFRLAEKRIKTKNKLDFDHILIPFKNAGEIIKIIEEKDEQIKITIDKNQISFTTDDYYLVSRVSEGNFPDYKQIIPKEPKTEVVVLKQDILNSLKLAHIFSDTFNRVTFNIDPEGKIFQIKTKNNDVGENTSNVSGALKGESLQISFNYKSINDCFQSIEADSVSLLFNGLNKPLVIKGVGDKSFFYLAMPMNK